MAGRALAATDPQRALAVLQVIEAAASRTLADMRSMVGTLRDGDQLLLHVDHRQGGVVARHQLRATREVRLLAHVRQHSGRSERKK